MAANSALQISELDFDTIKSNLIIDGGSDPWGEGVQADTVHLFNHGDTSPGVVYLTNNTLTGLGMPEAVPNLSGLHQSIAVGSGKG